MFGGLRLVAVQPFTQNTNLTPYPACHKSARTIIIDHLSVDAFDALPDADVRWQTVYNVLEARNLVDDTTRQELIATADRASNILEKVYWLARDENQDIPDLTEKIRRQIDEAEASITELRGLLND